MELTIIAIDRRTNGSMRRTFNTDDAVLFKEEVLDFENDLPYNKYELMCDNIIDEYPIDIIDVLDILEITY